MSLTKKFTAAVTSMSVAAVSVLPCAAEAQSISGYTVNTSGYTGTASNTSAFNTSGYNTSALNCDTNGYKTSAFQCGASTSAYTGPGAPTSGSTPSSPAVSGSTVVSALEAAGGVIASNSATGPGSNVFCGKKNGFYGVNVHNDVLNVMNADTVAAQVKDLGFVSVRINSGSDDMGMQRARALVHALKAADLCPLIVVEDNAPNPNINTNYPNDPNNKFTSEGDAYTTGYNLAQKVIDAMKPEYQAGETMWLELGNELDREQYGTIKSLTYAGNKTTDYVAPGFYAYRGVLHGMLDDVQANEMASVDIKSVIDFCVADTPALDMLWNGQQPDDKGNLTPGYPQIRPDVIAWHDYQVYFKNGDPFNTGGDGAQDIKLDVPAYVAEHFKDSAGNPVPFLYTELSPNPGDPTPTDGSPQQGQSELGKETWDNYAITSILKGMKDHKNMIGLQYYQLYGTGDYAHGGGFGIMNTDGKPTQSSVFWKKYIQQNPVLVP